MSLASNQAAARQQAGCNSASMVRQSRSGRLLKPAGRVREASKNDAASQQAGSGKTTRVGQDNMQVAASQEACFYSPASRALPSSKHGAVSQQTWCGKVRLGKYHIERLVTL